MAPLVVVILDSMGAWSTAERERVVVIPVALGPATRVSRIACVVVVTRVEIHDSPPSGHNSAGVARVEMAQARWSREAMAATKRLGRRPKRPGAGLWWEACVRGS